MNFLVIATHHGAFLTIQQLKERKVKNVTVVIPQSQIDKYKTFEGKIFTNYQQNLKKVCGKKIPVFVMEDWMIDAKIDSTINFLHGIGAKGEWIVLEAGSLLGENVKFPKFNTIRGVVFNRVYPNRQKLYEMIGKQPVDRTINLGCFFINLNSNDRRTTVVDSWLVHRPDHLYAKSFGTLGCIRHQQGVKDCVGMAFWMEAIRKKQESGEWVAYPYDRYLQYAKKVQKYLPESSFKNIESNGLKTEWLRDLIALDL